MADRLTERLQREAGAERPAAQVQRAFALAYARPAAVAEAELEAAVCLDRHARAARLLPGAAEFQ
jgi:hypothetical protein